MIVVLKHVVFKQCLIAYQLENKQLNKTCQILTEMFQCLKCLHKLIGLVIDDPFVPQLPPSTDKRNTALSCSSQRKYKKLSRKGLIIDTPYAATWVQQHGRFNFRIPRSESSYSSSSDHVVILELNQRFTMSSFNPIKHQGPFLTRLRVNWQVFFELTIMVVSSFLTTKHVCDPHPGLDSN